MEKKVKIGVFGAWRGNSYIDLFRKEDRIELIGDQGSVSFSVFVYEPIRLHTSEGEENITVPNPPYVQYPIIKNVIEHLRGIGVCECTSISATPVNWVLDRILGKF